MASKSKQRMCVVAWKPQLDL